MIQPFLKEHSERVCLFIGGTIIPFKETLLLLAGKNDEASDLIIIQFRLPRILATILIGAALAVAGAMLQGVIRNPLASPDLLAVTGGASVAVVAFMTLFTGYSIHWVPFTNWKYTEVLWPWVAVFIPLSILYAKELNVQSLGEATAVGLGSRLQLSRIVLLFYCVALARAAVGIAGMISFIGLLAPYMARKLVGQFV